MITGFNPADMYEPVWKLLTPEARDKVRKGNCERLFDGARQKVRPGKRRT